MWMPIYIYIFKNLRVKWKKCRFVGKSLGDNNDTSGRLAKQSKETGARETG